MNHFIGIDSYMIFDSKVNHLELSASDMRQFIVRNPETDDLTPCKYPFATMKIGDRLEFRHTESHIVHSVKTTSRAWVRKNKLNWYFSAVTKGNMMYVIRTR